MKRTSAWLLNQQHVGGLAAFYLAAAYLAAIPFFLVVLDYQNVIDPAAKLVLLTNNQGSLYAFTMLAYIVFGLVLTVLALALHDRLKGGSLPMARVIAVWGMIWSCLLIASGMVYNMGMEYVVNLNTMDASGAASAWQIIESVADGLGGAGGESLGGPWVLLVSVAGLRTKRLPTGLNWLGLVTGIVGVASNIPLLRESAAAFGLLQIIWFIWLGIVLLRTKPRGIQARYLFTSPRRMVLRPSTIDTTMADPNSSRKTYSSAPSPRGQG